MPIGVLTPKAAPPEYQHHRKTTLGISIADAYQSSGYGPEAINWALDKAFKFSGIYHADITCLGYNDRT